MHADDMSKRLNKDKSFTLMHLKGPSLRGMEGRSAAAQRRETIMFLGKPLGRHARGVMEVAPSSSSPHNSHLCHIILRTILPPFRFKGHMRIPRLSS
jgi:hypothetical protein